MKAIRKADSEAALQEAWRKFQASFRHAKKLIAYIRTWMEPTKLVKWVLYLREVRSAVLFPFVCVYVVEC